MVICDLPYTPNRVSILRNFSKGPCPTGIWKVPPDFKLSFVLTRRDLFTYSVDWFFRPLSSLKDNPFISLGFNPLFPTKTQFFSMFHNPSNSGTVGTTDSFIFSLRIPETVQGDPGCPTLPSHPDSKSPSPRDGWGPEGPVPLPSTIIAERSLAPSLDTFLQYLPSFPLPFTAPRPLSFCLFSLHFSFPLFISFTGEGRTTLPENRVFGHRRVRDSL